jgi:putative transposase
VAELPHDFPPWGTVHYYYRQWRRDGTWEAIQNALRTKVRHKAGRHKSPSAAIIDSQTTKTTSNSRPAFFALKTGAFSFPISQTHWA